MKHFLIGRKNTKSMLISMVQDVRQYFIIFRFYLGVFGFILHNSFISIHCIRAFLCGKCFEFPCKDILYPCLEFKRMEIIEVLASCVELPSYKLENYRSASLSHGKRSTSG